MTRIALITGASGFVGRATVPALVARGLSVRAAVRSIHDCDNLVDTAELVEVGNIGPDTDWRMALKNVESIIHLAGRAHVLKESANDPLSEFLRVNVDGTLKLGREAAEAGVRRFIYVSSIGVNGSTTTGAAFTEADAPAPDSLYAQSKWQAEQGLRRLQSDTGLEVVVVRPPLIYGPGAPGNLHRLARLISRGVPIPLANVLNRRSLIGIDNFIDLIALCAEHPAAAGETFLVADNDDVSTPELIRYLAEGLSCHVRLFPVPITWISRVATFADKKAIFDSLCGSLQVNATKARNMLGWEPRIPVREGVIRAANWYRDAWID